MMFALCLTTAVQAQSPCDPPTNVNVVPGATSATVSWTGSSEQYNVLYLNNLFYCSADDVTGWQSYDVDGDGYGWYLDYKGRSGADDDIAFVSDSYYYSALNPDNWLITPIINLGGTMSVWMKSYTSYYLDTFAIYLTTDLDFDEVEDFNIPLVVKSVAPYEWTEYTADLSAYAGQQGYIAIRHFNSYDRYALLMDDFRVDGEGVMLSNVSSPVELPGLTPELTNQVQVQAICTSGVSEWSNPVEFTTHGLCDAPSNLSVTPSATTASLEWTGYQDQYTVRYQTLESYNSYLASGMATVTLTIGDVWGDGSGYQMLLDADATAYGDIIPETGGLTTGGDASEAVYAEFEYKIPTNADGSLNTSNIVLNNSVTISIPAGTYDFCITNPTPGGRMWIASNNGTVNGREDDYVFEAGKIYKFEVTPHGSYDGVDVTITNNIPEDSWTTVTNVSNPAEITGLNPETTYVVQVQGICESGLTEWTELVEFTTPACVISEINIEGFTTPEWGANPDYEVNVPADANYTLDYRDWNWYDGDNEEILNESGTFNNEDYVYYMYFEVLPNEGCTFADDVTFTLNGEAGTIDNSGLSGSGNGYWAYSIDYTVTDPTTEPCVISEINIEGFTVPEWGANPDYTVNVPADANYTLNYVDWNWDDGDNMDILNESGTFNNEDYVYYMYFEVLPNEGCTFADDVTFTLNGEAGTIDNSGLSGSGNGYWAYSIDYTVTDPTTEPCETPTNLTATNITATTTKLGWTGNLDQYTVRYKDEASTSWTTATTTNSTLPLSGLTPLTTYTAQVQGDCGDGIGSVTDWSVPVTFTTLSGTVEPGECGPAVDCDGNSYPTVKIGDVCWMQKNLAAESCVTSGNVYAYVNAQFPDEAANVATYGLLYDEDAAMQGLGGSKASSTGICPTGYRLPTVAEIEALGAAYSADELKSTDYWISGGAGSDLSGFSWLPGGCYSSSKDNFESMLLEGYLWATEEVGGVVSPAMYKITYYCSTILMRVEDHTGLSASVRCVKE